MSLIVLMMKCSRMFHASKGLIHVQTLVAKSSFKCFATKRVPKVRRSTSRVSKNVIYTAFCLNCLKQRVGSTVDWKPRLLNYKSHINKKVRSCSIANHFIDVL